MSSSTKKPTLIVRAPEAEDIIDYLDRLAKVYAALGTPEDEEAINVLIGRLKARLGQAKKGSR